MAQLPKEGKSFADVNPHLINEWHPIKNGTLTPFMMKPSSPKKVWWKCPKGEDHEWQAGLNKRTNGRGCPICSGYKVVESNSLLNTHPELSKQWHKAKNSNLSPENVHAGSVRKVWWRCVKCNNYEWQKNIRSAVASNECQRCNSFAETFKSKDLIWHPDKNTNIDPYQITKLSEKKAWWICTVNKEHVFKRRISYISSGHWCPYCNPGKRKPNQVLFNQSLKKLNPEISKLWNYKLNEKLKPEMVTPASDKKVWWKCPKADDHIFKKSPYQMIKLDISCDMCGNRKIVKSNCLKTTHSILFKEIITSKNHDVNLETLYSKSEKKIWWKCPKGDDHEWKASVYHRVQNNSGCPICEGLKVVKSNSLSTTHPKIAKEWHQIKNGDITPRDIIAGSNKKFWWKCPKGDDHEWETSAIHRSQNNSNCPICSGHKVVRSTCLAITHPDLVKEWHPNLNIGFSPFEYGAGSPKKVWWKCAKGEDHEWQTSINSRKLGTGCPFCTLTPQSKQELTITFELIKFFKDINPKGFKTRVKGKLWSIDIYIPQLKLGIEFDGSYWHKDKRALDKLKTEQLEDEGFEIFRVREEPLKRIFADDIMSKKPFNAKQLTNDILTQIMSRYALDSKKIAKIESYIAKKELQNEKDLDNYIDMILTEKAEKAEKKK